MVDDTLSKHDQSGWTNLKRIVIVEKKGKQNLTTCCLKQPNKKILKYILVENKLMEKIDNTLVFRSEPKLFQSQTKLISK